MRHSIIGAAFAVASVLSAVSMTDTCYAATPQDWESDWRLVYFRKGAPDIRRATEDMFKHTVTGCRKAFEHGGLSQEEQDRREICKETLKTVRLITLRQVYIGRDGDQHNYFGWNGHHAKIYGTNASDYGGINISSTNIDLGRKNQYRTDYIISGLDTIRATNQYYPAQGRMAVLNFANATQPGGEFLNGGSEQEESLCRSTTLYASLISKNARIGYYAYNLANAYSTRVMVSPDVFVIRDSDAGDCRFSSGGGEYDPDKDKIYEISVLTAAAFRANNENEANSSAVQAMMRTLVRNILLTAIAEGYDTLILGAFGTGVYHHDAATVAGYFREALIGTSGNPGLGQYFRQVVFAIPDAQKRRAFEQAFGVQTTVTDDYHLNF